jgi:TP901 family phage tail tape measure protein
VASDINITLSVSAKGIDTAIAKVAGLGKSIDDLSKKEKLAVQRMISKLPISAANVIGEKGGTPYGTQTKFQTQPPHGGLLYQQIYGQNLDNLPTVDQKRLDAIAKDFDKGYGKALEKALVGGTADNFLKSRQQYYAGMIVSKIGYALQTAGATIVAGLGLSIKAFGDFEQAMRNTQSVTDATANQLARMGSIAKELSQRLSFSSSEVAGAMYYLGSAGYEAEEIIKSIIPISELAQGTQSDLASTTEFLATTMAAFNIDASRAGEVANIMAASISHTQTTMVKLRTAMSYIGPEASAMGLGLEEMVAIMGAAADVGMRASQMGTYLRQVIQRLVKPSRDFSIELSRVGLTLKDVMPSATNSVVDILEKLNQKGINGSRVMALFGVRAGELAQVIQKLGPQGMERYFKHLTDTSALSRIVAIQTDSLNVSFQKLWHSVTNLGIAMGEKLRPHVNYIIIAFQNIAMAIERFISGGSALRSTLVMLIPTVAALFALISGFTLSLVGPFISGLIGIVKITEVLSLAMKGIGISFGIMLRWASTATIVILALGAAFVYLANKMGEANRVSRENKTNLAIYTQEYIKLASNVNRTATEEERLSLVKKQIIALYPQAVAFINDENKAITELTKSYQNLNEQTFGKVKDEAKAATLSKLDLRYKIIEEKNRINKISAKLTGSELWDSENNKKIKEHKNVLAGLEVKYVEAEKTLLNFREASKIYYSDMEASKKRTALGKLIKPEDEADFATALGSVQNQYDQFILKMDDDYQEAYARRNYMAVNYEQKRSKALEASYIRERDLNQAKANGLIATDDELNKKLLESRYILDAELEELNRNRYFDFTMTDKEIANSFADTIYDMVKGIKTWEDVWQSVLDQSLKYFIQGFVNQVMSAWGGMIAQMINSGIGVIGGGDSSFWGQAFKWMGAIGGASSMGAGGASGMVGASATASGVGANFAPQYAASGGIVKSPTLAMVGEAGPEAIIPLDQYNNRNQTLTIVNVIDPSFVPSVLSKNPDTVINIISGDIMNSGVTRKVIRRYSK